jgi:Zn-dependent metalloprotease
MRVWWLALAVFACALAAVAVRGGTSGSAAQPPGFFVLDGAAAARYVPPSDTLLVKTLALGDVMLERYQQSVAGARVLGGQITVYRDGAGVPSAVVGAHYPGLRAAQPARLSQAEADAAVDRRIGRFPSRQTELMIDPANGRLFYRVESRAFDDRWVHWIDAASGAVLREYRAIESGSGSGV